MGHEDQTFVKYILQGIAEGFRVGFNYQQHTASLQSCRRNMVSAAQAPQVVSDYLTEEVALNRVMELPLEEAAGKIGVHCSPFGVIPKKNKPGKWRLIVDLSSPEGHSVNDGIDREQCSFSYTSVDEVAGVILQLGQGAMLAKMDIKQAYRIVPVHPQDRPLLGMGWQGVVFIDKALPFGLRSAPLIFSALADALMWIMQKRGATPVFHYVDDFITIGQPGSNVCETNLQIMKETCHLTGTPIEEEKCEGPATQLTFLGLELDTVAKQIRLPRDKLKGLLELLAEWRKKKASTKRDLLSLIGSLSHACKAIKPGRTFLRRLIDLSTVAKHNDHFIRLNKSARSDIEWWFQFARQWNGTAMLSSIAWSDPQITLTSDASGGWGCGAYCGLEWFQLRWSGPTKEFNITVKELIPIVIAAALWGSQWAGSTVKARCDNAAVVAIINRGSSKDQEVMHLMRCLAFIAARYQFSIRASHLSGVCNTLADALSRDRLSRFRSHHPQARSRPSAISPELLDLLIVSKPDWTSPHWTNLWSSIFVMD